VAADRERTIGGSTAPRDAARRSGGSREDFTEPIRAFVQALGYVEWRTIAFDFLMLLRTDKTIG